MQTANFLKLLWEELDKSGVSEPFFDIFIVPAIEQVRIQNNIAFTPIYTAKSQRQIEEAYGC